MIQQKPTVNNCSYVSEKNVNSCNVTEPR